MSSPFGGTLCHGSMLSKLIMPCPLWHWAWHRYPPLLPLVLRHPPVVKNCHCVSVKYLAENLSPAMSISYGKALSRSSKSLGRWRNILLLTHISPHQSRSCFYLCKISPILIAPIAILNSQDWHGMGQLFLSRIAGQARGVGRWPSQMACCAFVKP